MSDSFMTSTTYEKLQKLSFRDIEERIGGEVRRKYGNNKYTLVDTFEDSFVIRDFDSGEHLEFEYNISDNDDIRVDWNTKCPVQLQWIGKQDVDQWIDDIIDKKIANYSFEKSDKFVKNGFSEILKIDSQKRLVGVIPYKADTIDTQDDITDLENLKAAATEYMLNYQTVKIEHGKPISLNDARVIESFVSGNEKVVKEIEGRRITIPPRSWWVLFKVSKKIFQKIKDGMIRGVSIGGTARGKIVDGIRHLYDIVVKEISFVKNPATKIGILVAKSEMTDKEFANRLLIEVTNIVRKNYKLNKNELRNIVPKITLNILENLN